MLADVYMSTFRAVLEEGGISDVGAKQRNHRRLCPLLANFCSHLARWTRLLRLLCRQESEKFGMLAIAELDGLERLEFVYAMP